MNYYDYKEDHNIFLSTDLLILAISGLHEVGGFLFNMCSASLIRIKSELTDSITIWRARFLWPYLRSIICSSRFCSSQWIRRNSKLIKSQTRAASLLTLRKILLFKTQKRLSKFPFFFCTFIFPTSKTTTAEHIWIYALLIFLYIIRSYRGLQIFRMLTTCWQLN